MVDTCTTGKTSAVRIVHLQALAFRVLICEYVFMFVSVNRQLLLCGLLAWFGGSIALRAGGQYVLPAVGGRDILLLFAVSGPACAWFARGLCRAFRLERDQWSGGVVALVLPTLLLDAFSAAFFPTIFPNIAPSAAGAFGGWMLCCCAGALLGGHVGSGPRA